MLFVVNIRRTLQPVIVVFLATAMFVVARYAIYQDWMAFVDYDGYFSYFIARWGFDVEKISPLMDSVGSSYRYQRIIYPFVAYLLSAGGDPLLSPFFLVVLNIFSILIGTYFMSLLLNNMGTNPWYSLVYGLYGGQFLGLMTSLTEPLAYLFVVAGIYFWSKDKLLWSTFSFSVAILTKEVAILFVIAFCIHYGLEKNWKKAVVIAASAVPYTIWQVFLAMWLGAPGFSSGQSFEFPLWGWLSGIFESPESFYLLAIALIPMSYLPMILLGTRATIDFLFQKIWHPYVLIILIHVGFMVFLPRLTAREPSAMVRITQGLMIGALLYGSLIKSSRILNYSVLWIATLALIINGSGRDGILHFE